MNRNWPLAVLALALSALAAQATVPEFEQQMAVQESLSRVHPRMRASWLKERGIDDPYYTSARKPDSEGLRVVGRWSHGPSYDVDGRVTPSETLVALARGSGVSLLRFSRQDSLTIQLLSDINAEGLMCRVKVVDTLLYVGSRGGLEVYNIADERNPTRLSYTPIPLNDFSLQDSLAYTISGDDSFRIYNVSDPANPVRRGACRDSGSLISACNGYAYLGDRWGLYVIDATNPASPHLIGSWGTKIEQVKAQGTLCFVTTSGDPGDITFHVLDVTSPANPQQVGSLDQVGGNDVCFVDTLAFGAGEEDFNNLTVISIADPSRPRLVGSAVTRGWSMGIWASGLAQSTFVGCHWEGLQVYDTRNPALPVRDTFLLGADQSVDICIDNGRAYVANEMAGLKILDISNPTEPTTLGSLDTTWQMPFMTSVAARDSFAFVDWYDSPRLRVLDVAVPARPTTVGGCRVTNTPQDMVLRDSFVYIAEVNRFQIVNVARPREPVLVGSCVIGNAGDLVIADTLALASRFIISIADPTAPVQLATLLPVQGYAIAVKDTFAFAPAQFDSLVVFSIANPAAPVQVGRLRMSGGHFYNWGAALDADRLYVGGDILHVVDVSEPATPREVGHWHPPSDIRRLTYAAPYLYAACWEGGVCVLESTAVAVEEPEPETGQKPKAVPTVVRGAGWMSLGEAGIVMDAAGRRVAEVGPGRARPRLAPGVYFVREAQAQAQAQARTVRKIVVLK